MLTDPGKYVCANTTLVSFLKALTRCASTYEGYMPPKELTDQRWVEGMLQRYFTYKNIDLPRLSWDWYTVCYRVQRRNLPQATKMANIDKKRWRINSTCLILLPPLQLHSRWPQLTWRKLSSNYPPKGSLQNKCPSRSGQNV